MNILLLLITIVISFIIVRTGAIAFELTGLERSIARFQSLSCFSGTGFTTREAEAIVSHPQRRRIATVLIILGNAGLVTMIATFANSLRPNVAFGALLGKFMPDIVPPLLIPWVNLTIIVIAVYSLYKLFSSEQILDWLRNKILTRLTKYRFTKPVHVSEHIIPGSEYGSVSAYISKGHKLMNRPLGDMGFKDAGILTLLFQYEGEEISSPPDETVLKEGAMLTCFGKVSDMRARLL